MAIELVRQIWCDIDLKQNKEKVDAEEGYATILKDGRFIRLDACPNHIDKGVTIAQIEQYGYPVEQPHADRSRMGDKLRARANKTANSAPVTKDKADLPSIRGGTRTLVQCTLCGKQVTSGSGWGLHNNAHVRKGETGAEAIPVAV